MFTSHTSECNTPGGLSGNVSATAFLEKLLSEIKPGHAVEDIFLRVSDSPDGYALGLLTINYLKTQRLNARITFQTETFVIYGETFSIRTCLPVLDILGMPVLVE